MRPAARRRLIELCSGLPGVASRRARPPASMGLWLDIGSVDWDEVEGAVLTPYRMTAPKRPAAQLDQT